MYRLLFGNLLSLFGAVFLGASCFAKEKRSVYLCLFAESLLLAAAQTVFSMPAGAVALLVAAGRNLLAAFNRFGEREAVLFSVLTLLFGCLADRSAIVGAFGDPRLLLHFLPVVAGVQLTLASSLCKSLRGIKRAVLFNIFLWIAYSFYILDVVTAFSDLAIFVIDLLALREQKRSEKKSVADTVGK